MSYLITDNNYSVLNNYVYENKSGLISALDWLSTPCRRVLGGRNVYVLNQTEENQMSPAWRVTVAVLSILIFPIAVVSIASLLVKMGSLPWIWEQRKVKVISEKNKDTIHKIESAVKANNYDEVIKIYQQRPDFENRKAIYDGYFKAVNSKVISRAPWGEIQSLFRFLKTDDIIILINHAVNKRLSYVNNNAFNQDINPNFFSGEELEDLIKNSLRNRVKGIDDCCQLLISSAFQIDSNDIAFCKAVKMELADHLILFLRNLRVSEANDIVERSMVKVEEINLRSSIFKKGENQNHPGDIIAGFGISRQLTNVFDKVDEIRKIHQMKWQVLDKLKDISKHKTKNLLVSGFNEINSILDELSSLVENDQKPHIVEAQQLINSIVRMIHALKGNEEVLELASDTILESSIALHKQVQNDYSSISSSDINPFKIAMVQLHQELLLKKKADTSYFLIMFTAKLSKILSKE